ncbi:MAG: hypothetical protein ISR69_04760 [Gammaproteobacteria bacterium]|nr:hypothetical protein [Gammaproteobacteria bacterium]
MSKSLTFNHSLYHRVSSPTKQQRCEQIQQYFYDALNNDSKVLEKTHFFNGRYENIYFKDPDFQAMNALVTEVKNHVAEVLSCSAKEISMDFWFNDMPPGHVTDWHRHDVMDEKLSGVFYVKVPQNSGDLLIEEGTEIERIKPKENDFVFFKPDQNHYVERNKSDESRLSIGMNFGYLHDKED